MIGVFHFATRPPRAHGRHHRQADALFIEYLYNNFAGAHARRRSGRLDYVVLFIEESLIHARFLADARLDEISAPPSCRLLPMLGDALMPRLSRFVRWRDRNSRRRRRRLRCIRFGMPGLCRHRAPASPAIERLRRLEFYLSSTG